MSLSLNPVQAERLAAIQEMDGPFAEQVLAAIDTAHDSRGIYHILDNAWKRLNQCDVAGSFNAHAARFGSVSSFTGQPLDAEQTAFLTCLRETSLEQLKTEARGGHVGTLEEWMRSSESPVSPA